MRNGVQDTRASEKLVIKLYDKREELRAQLEKKNEKSEREWLGVLKK